jgi:hypothetical protein
MRVDAVAGTSLISQFFWQDYYIPETSDFFIFLVITPILISHSCLYRRKNGSDQR